MRLDTQNVEAMLNEQVLVYLRHTLTYEILRSNCLTTTPIQFIVNSSSTILDNLAAADKTQTTTQLTQQAHSHQVNQDVSQEIEDTLNASTYKSEKQERETRVSSLNTELFAINTVYLVHQLLHSGADRELQRARSNIQNLENRIRDMQSSHEQHRHGHGHEHKHQHNHSAHPGLQSLEQELGRERQHVSRLHTDERREFTIFFQHQTNKHKIENEISNSQSHIKALSKQQDSITAREAERNLRRSALRNHPNESPRQALSMAHANQLDMDIQAAHRSINTICSQMKNTVRDTCYQVFLNQLDRQIESLGLAQNEKTALRQILAKMNEYQRDAHFKQQQESELSRLNTALQVNMQNHAHKQSEYGRLNVRNALLINANELLNSQLLSLHSSHEALIEMRNFYTIVSLAATGTAGVGSLTAYFLIQAGIIAFVPIINIVLAAIVGVVLMGLIITASVAAIQASFKQSEIDTCEQTFINNENEKSRNIQTMSQSQFTDLPNLVSNMILLEQQITAQTIITENARHKANSSRTEANEIRINTADFGNNNSTFFTPSAPPMPVQEDDQTLAFTQ